MRLFRPKCPVNEDQRLWIEESVDWLIGDFQDYDLLRSQVVLPTPEFFPDAFSGTEQCVRRMVDRVCMYMHIDPGRLDVQLFDDRPDWMAHPALGRTSHHGPAGLFIPDDENDKIVLGIESSGVSDPMSLVATIAHELGHVHLIADNRLTRDRSDHEPLTDLLTVLFGMGIFTANSAFTFRQWDDDTKHGWSARKLGYLSEEMYGYALALYALLRSETPPQWARYLTHNVKVYMSRSHAIVGDGAA